jgi:hypothetical protein
MEAPRATIYPKLVTLSQGAGERFLALDCTNLIVPRGPIPLPGAVHHQFARLDADLLAEVMPTVVVIRLFAGSYDATAALERLEELGYGGRIFVIAPALPRPHLVEQELRAAGPGARLVLVTP